MIRKVHSLLGLLGGLVVSFMAITGIVLSLQPLVETATVPTGGGMSVADLAGKVLAQIPDTERIVRSASGAVTAYVANAGTTIDPANGNVLGAAERSPLFTYFTELHRSLFLGDGGRIAVGMAAAAMALLALSGILLLVKRMGGWRQLLSWPRGTLSQRLHVELARLAVLGLALSALTGIYMTLATFGVVGDGSQGLGFPATGGGGTPAPIASLAALRDVPLSDLRELSFPAKGDAEDVYSLVTNAGTGYVDQATGELIDFTPNAPLQNLYEAIYTLHTGQGHWWLAILLGMASLAVPALLISGIVVWMLRRKSMPRIEGNAGWHKADTVILVGSEGNTTWSFASTLRAAFIKGGHSVHIAPMNGLRRAYPRATRLIILTATYGDGSAPASASTFLSRLARLDAGRMAFAVLGFGDRKFRHYCGYAEEVDAALSAHGLPRLFSYSTIDRQSSQAFSLWGSQLGATMGEPLSLTHQPSRPRTRSYRLIERRDYGIEVQAPTTVLRFALPDPRGLKERLARFMGLDGFSAGDLIGIVPPGDLMPRYYSIASSARDGVLEICVRKQQGGLCSEYLLGLHEGQEVEGFVRSNPDFRPGNGKRPLVLIGSGAGVAPLMGFVRANAAHRPVHLYFGVRDPRSDFLYREEIGQALASGHLTRLAMAFSRLLNGQYVQDRMTEDAEQLRGLARQGARFMVCGSMAMGDGVRAAMDTILEPLGLSVERLQASGRYVEDVY